MAEEMPVTGLDQAIRAQIDEAVSQIKGADPDTFVALAADELRDALTAVLDLHESGPNTHARSGARSICLGCSDPKWNVLTFAPCLTVRVIAEKLGVEVAGARG